MRTLLLSLGCTFFATTSSLLAEEARLYYGRDIRPILAENCFYCHGQDANQRKADVRLDTAKGQQAVITAGKPEESELIRRIFSEDPSEVMPTPKSNRHLTPEQKKTLQRWIQEGAVFEDHWAFRPIERPNLPFLSGDQDTGNNPIDRFIRHRLQLQGIQPSPTADRRTLLRRVSLDLIGALPTPEEIQQFVEDTSPLAYEKVVRRLLSDPRYGERMALPWLDAARYADSNGFQQDGDTFQWVWRDWVVQALNANMPFDQFTVEQLAGDLLPNPTVRQKIATAFNRNHLVNGEGGAIPEEQRFNILFDRIDVTATNWLGLTMACAQCHDHKYDPMTMKDYYSLMAAFNHVSESGTAGRQTSAKRVSSPFIEVPQDDQLAYLQQLDQEVQAANSAFTTAYNTWKEIAVKNDSNVDANIRKLLQNKDPKGMPEREKEIRKYFEEKVNLTLAKQVAEKQQRRNDYRNEFLPKVMVMADDRPRETHILDRGEYLKKKEVVTFDVPAFLPPLPKDAPKNRLGLAKWLIAKENPLTARVAVNRMWQIFFGMGLVKTSEDLGVQSEVPIHQELLDWLAAEFMHNGWNVKAIHYLIVTSATYQQSSKLSAELLRQDPENRWYARNSRFRLPSMILRDIALQTSGLLRTTMGGSPTYPYQPEGIWDTLAITKERDFTYPKSHGNELYRRSLYTFWRRTVGPANMFDASNRQTCRVRPNVTNTPLHALTTLNDPTWTEAARHLAQQAMCAEKANQGRIQWLYQRILARNATERELAIVSKMLQQQLEEFNKTPSAAKEFLALGESPRNTSLPEVEHAGWTALSLAILNLDEALTRE